MKRLSYLFLVFFALSCSRRIIPSSKVEIDSVFVKTVERVRDTILVVEADSSLLKAYVECDSLNNVRIRQIISYKQGRKMPVPQINIKDNILTAKASLSDEKLLFQYKERYNELKIKSQKQEIKVIEVNRIKNWQKTLMLLGALSIAYTLTKIIKIIKI